MFNLKILEKLYFIRNRSHDEGKISRFVQRQLKDMGLKYSVDKADQIYNIIPRTPLLSAHLDSVGQKQLKELFYDANKKAYWAEENIGADDKNGVFLILELLKKYKNNVSFIFSCGEESGGHIGELLRTVDVSENLYALVFDRRGKGDIIGKNNGYCAADFEDRLKEVGAAFNYAPATGSFSDADALSEYLAAVNLSVGYYEPHQESEYTIIPELENCFNFACAIIDTVKEKYPTAVDQFASKEKAHEPKPVGGIVSYNWREQQYEANIGGQYSCKHCHAKTWNHWRVCENCADKVQENGYFETGSLFDK